MDGVSNGHRIMVDGTEATGEGAMMVAAGGSGMATDPFWHGTGNNAGGGVGQDAVGARYVADGNGYVPGRVASGATAIVTGGGEFGGNGHAPPVVRVGHRGSSLPRPLTLAGMTPLQPVPELGRGFRRESEGDEEDSEDAREEANAAPAAAVRGGTGGDVLLAPQLGPGVGAAGGDHSERPQQQQQPQGDGMLLVPQLVPQYRADGNVAVNAVPERQQQQRQRQQQGGGMLLVPGPAGVPTDSVLDQQQQQLLQLQQQHHHQPLSGVTEESTSQSEDGTSVSERPQQRPQQQQPPQANGYSPTPEQAQQPPHQSQQRLQLALAPPAVNGSVQSTNATESQTQNQHELPSNPNSLLINGDVAGPASSQPILHDNISNTVSNSTAYANNANQYSTEGMLSQTPIVRLEPVGDMRLGDTVEGEGGGDGGLPDERYSNGNGNGNRNNVSGEARDSEEDVEDDGDRHRHGSGGVDGAMVDVTEGRVDGVTGRDGADGRSGIVQRSSQLQSRSQSQSAAIAIPASPAIDIIQRRVADAAAARGSHTGGGGGGVGESKGGGDGEDDDDAADAQVTLRYVTLLCRVFYFCLG